MSSIMPYYWLIATQQIKHKKRLKLYFLIPAVYYGNLNKEVIDMIKKILIALSLIVILLTSIDVKAETFTYVEIFDPKQDKVVKVVQSNPQIQDMVTSWITNIEGIYKNDPATDDGYVVKIPLDPIVKVNSKALKASVSEVFILIPEKDPPCYLIFEDENKSVLSSFIFNGYIDRLSNILGFELKK
jgi:hypothetical protein